MLILAGYVAGNLLRPSEDPKEAAATETTTPPVRVTEAHRVPKSPLTFVDTLRWREELSESAYQTKLSEALYSMPLSNLRELAAKHREIAYTEQWEDGYSTVHAALIERAPWIAVRDLVENLEWERATLFDADEDLDLETLISRTLAKLYKSEPERVLDVYRNFEIPLVFGNDSMFTGFENEALIAVVEAAEGSAAGKKWGDRNGTLAEAKKKAKRQIYAALAQTDPEQALERAENEENSDLRKAAMLAVLANLKDPAPAARRFVSSGQLGFADVSKWLPEDALAWARRQPPGDSSALSIAESAMRSALKSGNEEGRNYARDLAHEFFPPAEAGRKWERHHRWSAPKNAEWLRRQSSISPQDIDAWALENQNAAAFSEAKKVMEDLPSSRNLVRATSQFAGKWAALPGQQQAAANWAASLVRSGVRHESVKGVADAWARSDAMAATRWAVQLEPVELRAAALDRSLGFAYKKDASAARALLQRARLPAKTTAMFSKRFEPPASP